MALTYEQERKLLKYNEDIDFKLANKVYYGIKDLLLLSGEDPERDGLKDTPFRVIKSIMEFTEGYREDPKIHLEKTFDVDSRELIIVKDIEFYSNCEHHLVPFFGVAHVGYIPDKKITGLSKIARMVDGYAKRFQVQERLTQQITEAIIEVLEPQGVMVVIEAKHMCMCGRGIKKTDAATITSAVRGLFTNDQALRAEFLSLVNGGK